MELIFTGILLAIGFYIAPVVIGLCVGAVALVINGIYSLFGGGR